MIYVDHNVFCTMNTQNNNINNYVINNVAYCQAYAIIVNINKW